LAATALAFQVTAGQGFPLAEVSALRGKSGGGVCTVLTLVLLLGCRPRPSPEYEEAHQRFITLYAVHLDAAYVRPEMDQVVSLLQAVPPRSLDAQEARALLARIQAGRAQLQAEEEARRALVQEMLAGPAEEPDAAARTATPADAGSPAVLALLATDAGLDAGPRRPRVPSACAPTAVRLLLPFESRDTAFVSQGNNGRFTHQGASRFAFDFNVAIGTAVVAAAPGVVLQTQDMFDRSVDMDPDQYNFVLLDHGNGVLTEYGHLRHHGTRVRPAQRVAQGELIGYSGDTGMSTGPHLHFAVEDASLQSQPACFLDVESGVPRAGEVVRSGNVALALLPGEFRPASLPANAFASQEIALESELPLLLPDGPVEIRGRVLAPSREVILWVRPQGAKEPSRRQVVTLDAEGRFHLSLPLDGVEGIQWIGFSRVQPRGAWKGWALRRFDVSREASRPPP
jgi:murein DD-endopeptidase MepM/ murein hydrolase activator NlpD